MYVSPQKIPSLASQTVRLDRATGDTVIINIRESYQPSFTSIQNKPLNLPYTVESLIFENANKTALNGWLIKTKAKANGQTILFFHGNAGNIYSHYQLTLPLVSRGFQVFLFDYSGFGFSEGKATRDNILIDGEAAFQFVHKHFCNNQGKLILYGQSLGGHLAAVIAQKHEDQIDALIMEGAFSSHKDIAANRVWLLGRIFVKEKYSALKSLKNFHKPLLVIHSTVDNIIPFKLGRKLFEAANEPKTFYEIDKPHMMGPLYYADNIVAKINEMLVSSEP